MPHNTTATELDSRLAGLYAAAVAETRPRVVGNRCTVAAGRSAVAAAQRRGIDWRLIAAIVAAAVVAAPLALVLALYF